jgi:kynurenine formamidase
MTSDDTSQHGNASPWGVADEIGRLNRITNESRCEVLGALDGAWMLDLAVDYFIGMPSWGAAADPPYQTWLTHTPTGNVVDDLAGAGPLAAERFSYAGSAFSMYSHTGTHVCSLNHIGINGNFWNGWSQPTHLGSRAWSVGGVYPPIIARALLLDIATSKDVPHLGESYAITVDDLECALAGIEVNVQPTDIVLIRTGQMTLWPDPVLFLRNPPGLSMEAARYLADHLDVMCVGVDAGGEVLPPQEPDTFLPVHAYLLSERGVPIFENLWLEELSKKATSTFAFLGFPLKLRGSTGCPCRPVAASLGGRSSAVVPPAL